MFTSSQISAKVLSRHKTDYIILKFGGLNLEVHQEGVSNSVEEKLVQDSYQKQYLLYSDSKLEPNKH